MDASSERALRAAVAHDAALVLERAASEIFRVAANLDAISENTLRRIVGDLRIIAKLKRPRVPPHPVHIEGDPNFG